MGKWRNGTEVKTISKSEITDKVDQCFKTGVIGFPSQ